MERRKTEFLVNLEKVKKNKQKVMYETFSDLYDWMFTYVQSEANLREKVRAKHLFCHKLGLDNKKELPPSLQLHFEHWLLFDYVTVVGSRLFDLFVRAKKDEMSKRMLELSGILMLMHLEPFRIRKVEGQEISCTPLFKPEGKRIEARPFLFKTEFEEGKIVFARISTIGFEKRIIGPSALILPMYEEQIIDKLNGIYNQGHQEFRRYLKEYGVDMLKYGNIYDGS
ncbi:hypothetical protein ACM26V_11345 [Salipaludibacillus sp. HK11]|uniref:hypothetical protein n=1 Tax=Salipaludibacillus sp. HK11 TaxID=3394320 RepID=UPI0039FD371B